MLCHKLLVVPLLALFLFLACAAFSSDTKADFKYSDLLGRDKHLIDQHMMEIFGFKERPSFLAKSRPRRNITIPDHMWALYQEQVQRRPDIYVVTGEGSKDMSPLIQSNTIRSFQKTNHPGDSLRNWEPYQEHLRFDLSTIPPKETVYGSDIIITIPGGGPDRTVRLNLYLVVKPSSDWGRKPSLTLIDTTVRNVGAKSWTKLDATQAAARWLNKPSTNHGLVVEVVSAEGKPLKGLESHVRLRRSLSDSEGVTSESESDAWEKEKPVLVTYGDDEKAKKKRAKRNKGAQQSNNRKGKHHYCRRHKLEVLFKDVGWQDWIVAPSGYMAYFCQGECPIAISDNLNATNHAIVQNLVNSVYPQKVPRACCVPTGLSSISMLYLDDFDKVVLKNYQDMVVEACGCR